MLHVRPYVRNRGGAENDMPRMICRVQNPPVTLGVGYLGLFGGAQANSAPATPSATATMPNTGTNAAAAASTSSQAPKPGAKRGRKD